MSARIDRKDVVVCDYGAGNVRSVLNAFHRLGASVRVTSDPNEVLDANLAVLPGVGAARTALETLRATGVADALRKRVLELNAPTLGICLGLQLALEGSEENGGQYALAIVPGVARKIDAARIPRIGWALVEPEGRSYYFAHSYAAESPAATAHSEGVVAEIRSGSFVGVQFHPEKSGPAGSDYLKRCLSPA